MKRMLPAWLLVFLAAHGLPGTVRASGSPTVWEMTPYRIRVLLAMASEPELTPHLREQVEARVMERAEKAVGASWDLSVGVPPLELGVKMISSLSRLPMDDLPETLVESDSDKLLLVAVRVTDGGFQVEARDYDLHARLTGSPLVRDVRQRELLPDEVFQAVLSAFAPLARVEKVDDKQVTLRQRAASLPPIDPSIVFATPGDIYRSVRRYNDRDGKLKKLMPIEWTFLVVEQVNEAELACQMYTGLRSPLTGRSRGHDERLAMLVRPTGGSTELELHSRILGGDVKSVRPMAGYAVYAHPVDSTKTDLIGRTDGDGKLIVHADFNPLRILLVKHGGEPLARLPMMPGLEPRMQVDIPDDDDRLLAEGIINGFQERFVDVIARRQVLMTQIRARLEDNKAAEAKSMLEELRTFKRQEDYINEVRVQKQRAVSPDKRIQRKIDKLFDDTEQVIIRFLNPAEVEKIESEVSAKTRGS
ncbi:MAG TPA: hypothetical protein VG826_31380 [Pirellulales bacterium]|nr:hypothetical protein [Pirellulales bacterium]